MFRAIVAISRKSLVLTEFQEHDTILSACMLLPCYYLRSNHMSAEYLIEFHVYETAGWCANCSAGLPSSNLYLIHIMMILLRMVETK